MELRGTLCLKTWLEGTEGGHPVTCSKLALLDDRQPVCPTGSHLRVFPEFGGHSSQNLQTAFIPPQSDRNTLIISDCWTNFSSPSFLLRGVRCPDGMILSQYHRAPLTNSPLPFYTLAWPPQLNNTIFKVLCVLSIS